MDCLLALLLQTVMATVVLLGFARYYRQSKELDEAELVKTPLYSEQAAAQLGFTTATRPFVRISAYEGFFVVSCQQDKYVFTRENVSDLIVKCLLFSKRIIVRHSLAFAPRKVVLLPRNFERMYRALQASLAGLESA
jgi:hypothetical protein